MRGNLGAVISMVDQILVVGDSTSFCEDICPLLRKKGYQPDIAHDAENALKKLFLQRFHLLLTDIEVPGMNGLELFKAAKKIDPDISVIILTANGSIPSAVNAVKEGVTDYLQRPCDSKFLLLTIEKALKERHILQESKLLRNGIVEKYSFGKIIGKSPKMQQIFELIKRISDTDSAVFITGETGVGKELVAKAIHFNSPRENMPFVAINCGALAESLLESELFGHEKGAFTGAFKTKIGRFEYAHKGTLLLDEVGDIPPAMQVKLLRALQEKKVERVGGNQPIDVDVRVISATNRNIKEKISSHKFRIDLFYRLNVIPIHVPPLRERVEDVPLLVEHFLGVLNKNLNRNIQRVSARAMKQLLEYHWPGNVRELENVLQRAYVTSDGNIIDQVTFPQYVQDGRPSDSSEIVDIDIPFRIARSIVVRRFEKAYVSEALRRYEGNVSETAVKTGINPRTLWRKVREYNLDRMSFKKKNEL
jgi:DNA-binding NtrC family response regulator